MYQVGEQRKVLRQKFAYAIDELDIAFFIYLHTH